MSKKLAALIRKTSVSAVDSAESQQKFTSPSIEEFSKPLDEASASTTIPAQIQTSKIPAPAPAPAPAPVTSTASAVTVKAATAAPKCTACTKTVYKPEETIAVGRTWHNTWYDYDF